MANEILIIGVGSAGSKVVDKAMKDYPELFESVAIGGHPIGGEETSWPYINLLHDRCEPTGFMNHKRNVQEVMEENIWMKEKIIGLGVSENNIITRHW